MEPQERYKDGYESVPQAEIDTLTRDDLLAIATDSGSRQLVRCIAQHSAGGPRDTDEVYCTMEHGPGRIVAVDKESLVRVS